MNSLFEPRYRPFWALGAVALALLAYTVYWFARLAEFKETIGALAAGQGGPVSISARDISYGGFPYRISVTFEDATFTRERPDYALTFKTPELLIERQPWRTTLHLGFLETPKFTFSSPNIAGGVAISGAGESGRFSLSFKRGGVERLSTVLEKVTLSGGPWLETPLTAEKLEIHGRETAALRGGIPAANPNSPTLPTVMDIIINGENVQWGKGQPVTLAATLGVTADPQAHADTLFRLEDWRKSGGTLEIYTLNLANKKDNLAIVKGTFTLDDANRLLAGGTITTPCPAMIAGLFGQSLAAPEGRLKGLISLPFQAQQGQFKLSQPLTEWPSPARNRDAECPALRQ